MDEKWKKILKEANLLLEKSDFDGAIRLCDEVIYSLENSISREVRSDAFVVRGNAYQGKGDLDHAISGCNEAIKLNPKNAAAFFNRGNAYQQKGDFDCAISDYDEAIKIGFKLDSENSVVFNNRGGAYKSKGDFDRTISDCGKAIKLDPKNSAAFNNRGLAYKEKDDLDRAISDFNEAIKIGFKLDSENAAALSNRGNAYQAKGDFDRAINDHSAAIKIKPKNADALNNRGVAYREKGDFDHAISDYDEAIKIGFKLDSENAAALSNRGNAYQAKGDFDRAIIDYDKAIKCDPNLTGVFHNRALAYGRRDAQASEKKYREESERGLQKLREQSEQETKKLREELRQVSDPSKIITMYQAREDKYNDRIRELAGEIKTFVDELQNRLAWGFGIVSIVWSIFVLLTKPPVFAHGFALTSLMLVWLATNYPASIRLSDMRKEKRKMEICAEDYFRKLTLVLYTLASEGDERQKMMAATHAHFVTRSAAEFLADWNLASDDKSNPLLDSIEKIFRRKDDDSPPKPPEKKPSA